MFIHDIYSKLNENAETLNVGDPVIITGQVHYNGSTGEIVEFSRDKRFVIVDLYNFGRHSFHSSDVEHNDYADSDDEEAHMYDNDADARNWASRHEVDEGGYYNGRYRSDAWWADGGANDEGWDREPAERHDYHRNAGTKPKFVGMYVYDNVTPADERDALAIGMKKTKTGKWALFKYNTSGFGFNKKKASCDIAFGPGRYWEPKKTFEEETEVAQPEVNLPPPENAQKTQIAGTLPTYKKGKAHLDTHQPTGKTLDFGAGLGGGAAEMGADSYEPFPREGFKPTYTKSAEIPSDSYHRVTNFNVLNVVPQNIRNTIVSEIGRVLAPGGVAIITTRGKDVMSAKGAEGPEPMSRLTTIGTYQKGFTTKELMGYVQQVLGNGFEVKPIKLGPAGVLVRKVAQEVDEHIVKHGSGYRLLSHKGKNLGTFSSHKAAAKHEGEVEWFKAHPKK
jgi:SAM-dependent methyltransferase